jgi:hypothetical protein
MTKQMEVRGQRVKLYNLDGDTFGRAISNRSLPTDNGRNGCAWSYGRGLSGSTLQRWEGACRCPSAKRRLSTTNYDYPNY